MIFDELVPHNWLCEKMAKAFFQRSRSFCVLSSSRLSRRSSSRFRALMPTPWERFFAMFGHFLTPLLDRRVGDAQFTGHLRHWLATRLGQLHGLVQAGISSKRPLLARKKEQEAFSRNRELCMTCSRKSMAGSRGVSLQRRCCMSHQCSQRSLLLAPHELGQLKLLVQAHRTPQAVARRAQLIEASHTHPDWGTKQMARVLHRHESWVRKWRRRWDETHVLTDTPIRRAPSIFRKPVRAQVTALACSLPRSHGVPLAHWSRVELACHVATIPTLPTISARTIGRWLTAEQIRPWQFHSWQHIQDPEIFLQRARPVLRLYEHTAALLDQGIWVVCTDEKTSIQARQAEQAPRPAIHKHPVYQSPRYKRQGALHLMAALSVADGLVYGQCHPRKRFVDFRCFLETVLLVEAQRRRVQTVALILDNGSTHAPKQLTRWVPERATTLDGKLTMQLYWLPTNASWLDQIEIWFSLLQRKLLQPNHFCSLDELEQAILDFITHYNQTAKPLQWSYTVEKLERKLAPRLIREVKST